MPIEIESPEQLGYGNIECNLTESSVSDAVLGDLDLQMDDLVLAYGHHVGKMELRGLLAQDGLHPDDVLITAGAAAALFIGAATLLERGDQIIVAKPNYATNIETPRAIGAEVVYLPLTFENRYHVEPGHLRRLISERTKLVSLTSPHNPTGAMMTPGELREIVEIVERAGAFLLLDETYREMAFGDPLPLAASLSAKAIGVCSLSKTYGLPGIRIGWITCRDHALMERFLAAKEQIFVCNSVVDEEIAYRFLNKKDIFLAKIRQRTRANFATLCKWMSEQQYLEWIQPQGGVVCFPRFKDDVKIDIDRFYRILNDRYKTHVGPGHWFEENRRSMRIGYGWPPSEELSKGLNNIGLAIEESMQK